MNQFNKKNVFYKTNGGWFDPNKPWFLLTLLIVWRFIKADNATPVIRWLFTLSFWFILNNVLKKHLHMQNEFLFSSIYLASYLVITDNNNSCCSYAARSSPSYEPFRRHSSSRSASPSSPPPVASGKIKFITSFGGDSDGAEASDKEEGVTGVIILPKGSSSSSSSSSKHKRDHRKKNRWDQTCSDSREDGGSSSRRRGGGDGRTSREREYDSRYRDRHSRDRGGGDDYWRDRDRSGLGGSGGDRYDDRYRGRDYTRHHQTSSNKSRSVFNSLVYWWLSL